MTGSWIIVSKASGEAVMETFSRKVADAVNLEKFTVMTALDYLVSLNAALRKRKEESI
jgi:hypothetical protein